MGGLRHAMPWTLEHCCRNSGHCRNSASGGFFSKDAVLWAAWNYATTAGALVRSIIAASFTSFYMFRLLILTFYGAPRYTEQDVHQVHESPQSMLIPLIVLAICSILRASPVFRRCWTVTITFSSS